MDSREGEGAGNTFGVVSLINRHGGCLFLKGFYVYRMVDFFKSFFVLLLEATKGQSVTNMAHLPLAGIDWLIVWCLVLNALMFSVVRGKCMWHRILARFHHA